MSDETVNSETPVDPDPMRPLWQIALMSIVAIPIGLLSIPLALVIAFLSLLLGMVTLDASLSHRGMDKAINLVVMPWLMAIVGFGTVWYVLVEKPREARRA
jgi:hypothetical protein